MPKSPSRSYLAGFSLALGLLGLAVGGPAASAESQEALARDLVPSQKPMYDLGSGHHGGGDFGVEAWVDNPDLVYRVGQRLRCTCAPSTRPTSRFSTSARAAGSR